MSQPTISRADDAYDRLYVYAGTRGRERFILQHVVDAQGAQTATEETKPIAIVFALVGLFLHVERGFSGLRVQQVHVQLARQKRRWPDVQLPAHRGGLTASDVMHAPDGEQRDAAISAWCRSVWEAYRDNRQTIVALLQEHRVI